MTSIHASLQVGLAAQAKRFGETYNALIFLYNSNFLPLFLKHKTPCLETPSTGRSVKLAVLLRHKGHLHRIQAPDLTDHLTGLLVHDQHQCKETQIEIGRLEIKTERDSQSIKSQTGHPNIKTRIEEQETQKETEDRGSETRTGSLEIEMKTDDLQSSHLHLLLQQRQVQ